MHSCNMPQIKYVANNIKMQTKKAHRGRAGGWVCVLVFVGVAVRKNYKSSYAAFAAEMKQKC